MGSKDSAAKLFCGQADVLADIINLVVFDGRRAVMPEDIGECSPEIPGLRWDASGRAIAANLVRDIFVRVLPRGTGEFRFGLEVQSAVDGSMPLRCEAYDNGAYFRQNRVEGRRLGDLVPVFSATLYVGDAPWRVPCTVAGLMGSVPEAVSRFLPANVHPVLDLNTLDEKYEKCLCSEFRHVVHCRRLRKDARGLFSYLSGLGEVSWALSCFLDVCLDLKMEIEKKETVDMCKAVRDYRRMAMMEGIQQGRLEKIVDAVKSGLEQGVSAQLLCRILKITEEDISRIVLSGYHWM